MDKKRMDNGDGLIDRVKTVWRTDRNLARAVGYFALAVVLLILGALTGFPFLGLIGGGCLILGLERLVHRSAEKGGENVNDLRYKDTNRNNK